MTQPAAAPDAPLDDLRDLTLRRLAGLARLAALAAAMSDLVTRWFAAASPFGRNAGRVHTAVERVWRAIGLIHALEGKLRDSLRLIQSGVRPPPEPSPDRAAGRGGDADSAERLETAERPERPERLERETFPGCGPRGFEALLKRPVDDIVARILEDLSIFPAWRDLARSAWEGAAADPHETARALAAPIDAAISAGRRPSRSPASKWMALALAAAMNDGGPQPPPPLVRSAPA